MVTIQLTGRITQEGQLEVDLPKGLQPGEIKVTLEVAVDQKDLPWELRPWTTAELAALSQVEPKTGAEIVAWLEQEGGWDDDGTSGAEWVERIRHSEQERRG